MSILALATRVAMASILLWAGVEKARAPSTVVSVARRVGVPGGLARVGVAIVTVLELATGMALLLAPHAPATIAGVTVLALLFAAAGLAALRRGERIRCGCFGPQSDASLGAAQVAMLPLWIIGAAIVGMSEPSANDPQPSFLFAVVALTMAALRGGSALRSARLARADRRSAREMLIWLSR